MKFSLFSILLIFNISKLTSSSDDHLEAVSEDELHQLVIDEKYVLVLFMKDQQCAGECVTLEKRLLSVREELAEALGAWVIRCHAPRLLQSWAADSNSDVLVFFRTGKPMLYTGTTQDEEEMLYFLLANKESNVKMLTDATFEHETQASTGATTGDWLVLFTRDECGPGCDSVMPHLEAAGANLRGRKNVAHIRREADAAVTTRRFGVTIFPSVILFRLGRLYRYSHSVLTAADLTAFADDTFRNAQAEGIPLPKTPFDDVTQSIVDWLRENPLQFVAGVAGCGLLLLVLILLNSPPPQSWRNSNKKKKKQ